MITTPERPEQWRPIAGYEGMYEVSDRGRARSFLVPGVYGLRADTPRPIGKSRDRESRHFHVRLRNGRRPCREHLFRIVLETFAGPCPPGMEVEHIDESAANCSLDNLRWNTRGAIDANQFARRLSAGIDLSAEWGGTERWRPVCGWPGYEVSDWGQVRTWLRGGPGSDLAWYPRLMTPQRLGEERGGYECVSLSRQGAKRPVRLHWLVMRAFAGRRPRGLIIRHLDGNPRNNRLDNLAYGTHAENTADAQRHGTMPIARAIEREPILFFDPFIAVEAVVPWEVWKAISGHPGYEVSNFGRARSYWIRGHSKMRQEPHILKPAFPRGYPAIGMNGGRGGHRRGKLYDLHVLAIMAFSPLTPAQREGLVCRHVDGRKRNTHISNLKWATEVENARDKRLHGTNNHGERHGLSRLSDSRAVLVRERLAAGETGADLAREHGVSQATISHLKNGRTYRHLLAI